MVCVLAAFHIRKWLWGCGMQHKADVSRHSSIASVYAAHMCIFKYSAQPQVHFAAATSTVHRSPSNFACCFFQRLLQTNLFQEKKQKKSTLNNFCLKRGPKVISVLTCRLLLGQSHFLGHGDSCASSGI